MSSMHYVGTAPTVNAGTDQTITLPTSSVTLTGSATPAPGTTITTYAWTKVSGGSATITSASSASTTVTGLTEGSYVFRLTVTNNLSQSGSDDIAVTVNAAATPTITLSPASLTGLDAIEGSTSTPQSVTASAVNLTGNLLLTFPTNFEGSLTSGSGYAGTVTLTPSSGTVASTTVYVRSKSTAPAGSISGNLTATSAGATSKNVALSGTITASGGGSGVVAKFNFNLTAQSVADWVDVSGAPHSAVVTASDSRSGGAVTVSSKATAGWVPLSTSSSGNSGGETTGNASFPANTVISYWFTNTSPQTTPNVEISGLVPGATYKIELYGSRLASAVTGASRLMRYGCTDASTTEYIDDYDVKGNVSTTMRTSTNTGANVGGTTTGGGIATFNSKTADGSGKIQILVTSRNPNDGNNAYGYLGAMIITRL